MYDNVFVAQSLIDKATEGTDIKLANLSDGFYDFQTKSIDNSLGTWYIQEDGLFQEMIQHYKTIESDSTNKKDIFNFQQVPLGDPEYINDNRTFYIEFYDFYETEDSKERVFVTFVAHIKLGKLAEPISIKNIERTNLEEETIFYKKKKEEWKLVTNTWQWRLACLIFNIRLKVKRTLFPLVRKLDQLDEKLRQDAQNSIKQYLTFCTNKGELKNATKDN